MCQVHYSDLNLKSGSTPHIQDISYIYISKTVDFGSYVSIKLYLIIEKPLSFGCSKFKSILFKLMLFFPLCSNPFCKWFLSGFSVPKHLLTGYLEH